jgi:protein-tyrosine phosphatase
VIDLHLHLLPGVDDGAPDLAASLQMARALVAAGVHRAVVTPHIDDWTAAALPDRESVYRATIDLQRSLRESAIDLRLEAGGECYVTPELIDRHRAGLLPVWGVPPGALLIELPHHQRIVQLPVLLASLMRIGPRVLLAHPERYPFVQADPAALDDLVEAGLLLQLTASSFRSGAQAALSEQLLRRGIVHVVASDAHNPQSVAAMVNGLERLNSIAGASTVQLLTQENPAALLDGTGPLRPAQPDFRTRRSWFSFGRS